MKKLYIYALFIALFSFSACEDVVDVDVAKGTPALVVEGWLTDKPEDHYVKLYKTIGNSEAANFPALTNALVTLSDNAGNSEVLAEVSPGKYRIATLKSVEGRTYTLTIQSPVGNYEAVTQVKRLSMTPDSLTFKFEKESTIYEKEGYYPRIFGQELQGVGDFIQVKLYRNGKYMNKPNEFNLFEDEFVDGNYINNVELMVDSPFQKGEQVKAEVWSLTEDAYRFTLDIQTQLQNGQIFASPLVNARTNVKRTGAGGMPVVGYFGASLVESTEAIVE